MKKANYIVIQITAVLLGLSVLFLNLSTTFAAVRYGDRGDEVTAIQQRLLGLGYETEEPDGVFGIQTQVAVEFLQSDHGLSVDGVVGESTLRVLRTAAPEVSRRKAFTAAATRILGTAQKYIGVPYVWGGTNPSGFDCSGFTQYVFAASGIKLPRTADDQYEVGLPVRSDQLQPGDLVYFSTYEPGPSHNGIYLGGGKFINASSSRGVVVDRLDNNYWSSRYLGARRVIR